MVGAGPVGLSCALALRALGVETTVLEAEAGDEPRPGSRAIYIHRASLELLEHVHPGLGRAIAGEGLVWPTKRTFWRGREVYCRTYPAPPAAGLPPFASVPQTTIERHLGHACEAASVDIVRGARVEEITVSAESVELRTSAGAEWTAEYVIGADGARSAVRGGIGAELQGSRSENVFVVVDVTEDPQEPTAPARIFHYQHPAVGGRNVLLVPFAGGWRVDLQCRRDDDPALFAGAEVRSWIGDVLAERYRGRIAWISTYRFLQVVAASFVDDQQRVLLIGDAAHLFAPFGARGMNSGIADAVEAASAIAAALTATDDDAARVTAIERFAAERHRAALANRRAAGLALAAMQSSSPRAWIKRQVAATLAPRSERAGAWLDAAPYGPRLRDTRRGRRSGY